MTEMHYNLDLHIAHVDHLLKIKERIQKFKETGDTNYLLFIITEVN